MVVLCIFLGESKQQDGGDGNSTQRVLQCAVSAGIPGDRTSPGDHRDVGGRCQRSALEHGTSRHSVGEVFRRSTAAPSTAAVCQPTSADSAATASSALGFALSASNQNSLMSSVVANLSAVQTSFVTYVSLQTTSCYCCANCFKSTTKVSAKLI